VFLIRRLEPSCAKISVFGVLGFAACDSLPPHAKTGGFHVAAHDGDDLLFFEAKLGFDGFKGSPVFPGHFDDPVNGLQFKLWKFHARIVAASG
jgi:hypothetical protein